MLIDSEPVERAKQLAVSWYNANVVGKSAYAFIDKEDVRVVWFCKTLQNWKALVITTTPDAYFYEITYSGDKKEAYLDAYEKVENTVYPDPTRS